MRQKLNFNKLFFSTVGLLVLILGLLFWTPSSTVSANSNVTMEQISKGSVVSFGGRNWIVLDPVARKLLLRSAENKLYFWGYNIEFNRTSQNSPTSNDNALQPLSLSYA